MFSFVSVLFHCFACCDRRVQKEEGAEEDAPPKLVWITDAEASI
jgi:hypothetical protein